MDGIAVMARNSGTAAGELDPIHVVDQVVNLKGRVIGKVALMDWKEINNDDITKVIFQQNQKQEKGTASEWESTLPLNCMTDCP